MNDQMMPPMPPPQRGEDMAYPREDHDILIVLGERLNRLDYDQKLIETRNIEKSHKIETILKAVERVTEEIKDRNIIEQVEKHTQLLRDAETTYKVSRFIIATVAGMVGFLLARIFPFLIKYF